MDWLISGILLILIIALLLRIRQSERRRHKSG
jgi:hypothetical protein